MFLEIGVPKMVATEAAILGTTIFKEKLSLAATLYYLSALNKNLQCLRILQIILIILLKNE